MWRHLNEMMVLRNWGFIDKFYRQKHQWSSKCYRKDGERAVHQFHLHITSTLNVYGVNDRSKNFWCQFKFQTKHDLMQNNYICIVSSICNCYWNWQGSCLQIDEKFSAASTRRGQMGLSETQESISLRYFSKSIIYFQVYITFRRRKKQNKQK